ncbi:hypothetical protein BUALT_Bualt08G0050800 [Buddleja alternifolia]|uniref:Uncharacterized protein n=1 Tax=Buddleja alternifolia TaxID=168488 RepID=A0AAV6X3U6_9LAMI|nr:hypothetical protein BUALT_Bualt08G0050800 [Buddleja alternifolia]
MEDLVDSSGLAARNSADQEETSTLMATDSKPTEWTDAKHSLFLKTMEATFVDQLYKSLDLFHKNCPSESKSSKNNQTTIRTSSTKFKDVRDACSSKNDLRRDDPLVNQEEESGFLLTNSWIKHSRCSQRRAIRKFSTPRAKAPLPTTDNTYPGRDSAESNTEVTGQNFVDEDLQEKKSGWIQERKKTRTSTNIASYTDQVVPYGNIVRVE